MKKMLFFSVISVLLFSCSEESKKESKEPVADEKVEKNGLKNPALQKMMEDLNADDSSLESFEDGFHEIKYPNGGMKSTGTISNGKKEGLWTFFRENGVKWSECEFLGGKAHGKVVSYHPNGQIYYVGYFSQGVKAGTWVFYDEKSNIIKEENLSK